MRTAKDNSSLPRRYFRPKRRRCPYCQWKLKRWYTLWSKYLTTLEGRFHVFSQGYHCPNPECPKPQTVYRSAEAETLSVPECSYGVDVIVEVGYQRFWLRRTIQEIHRSLKERVSISERQVLNLLANESTVRSASPCASPIRLDIRERVAYASAAPLAFSLPFVRLRFNASCLTSASSMDIPYVLSDSRSPNRPFVSDSITSAGFLF